MEKASVEHAVRSRTVQRPVALVDDTTPPPSVMLDTKAVDDATPQPSVILDTRVAADTRSAAEVQHDTALEYDSMVLLATIEQLYIRLSDKMMYASTSLALEYLVNLTNHLVAFTEQLPFAVSRKFTLETLINRDRRNYSQLRLKHVRDGRLSFAAFEELHLRHGDVRHPKTFQQLSRDLLRVVNICLNICVKAFYATEMRQQWRTVYSGFLVNLARTMQRLYTPLSNGRGGG